MLLQINGIEQCTAVVKFCDADRDTGGSDHWAVYLTSMTKRDPRGSGYGPFVKRIATYAGNTTTSRMMALNHARALNTLIQEARKQCSADTPDITNNAMPRMRNERTSSVVPE
jgi:hypothetical protein